VTSGQKRALIHWTRLTRPDAVIVNLDSPSADPLGRAGVEGKVDSHFFARFGGAILQSVLNMGVGIATSAALKDGAFVALPSTAQAIPSLQPQQVQPTLKVRQGTSVSVFVARDLDFSSVEQ
jgi:type IV secretion system protein VirB10